MTLFLGSRGYRNYFCARYSPDNFKQVSNLKEISKFWVAGINYKKTDATTRGEFAIQNDQYDRLLEQARVNDLDEVFVLSTCNRTEIYGFADNASQLIGLLCEQTAGNQETFLSSAYIKNGHEAIAHLFNVSAGLDSQILGDYEIIGQLKVAVKVAKKHGRINVILERLINTVLQSSKAIKNQTELSGGTVSVSFAAIQYIREHVNAIADKKILLLGIGKIGKSTGKNLVHYLKTKNITLINRSHEKAVKLAHELNLKYALIDELEYQVQTSDIILLATNSCEPIILKSFLKNSGKKLIVDLSVPCNVEAGADELSNVTLINIDQLSQLKDENLKRREAEVPKAKNIISQHIAEFIEWHENRKQVLTRRSFGLIKVIACSDSNR